MDLSTDVKFIKGIGESRAKSLAAAGIYTAYDLLCLFPSDYENRGNIKKLSEVEDGDTVSLLLTVMSSPKEARGKSGVSFVKVMCSDETDSIFITFFNNKWIASSLTVGRKFRAFGKVTYGNYGFECVNPILETYSANMKKTVPIYPDIPGLNKSVIPNALSQIIELSEQFDEILPDEILSGYSLIKKSEAIKKIHFPENENDKNQAIRRLGFEELVVFQLALSKLRTGQVIKKAKAFTLAGSGVGKFFTSLPFELTNAQKRTVHEVYDDLQTEMPMLRLVQGDVGSGKTVIAAAAAYLAAKNKTQSAIMAPTEILASQHYKTLTKLFENYNIKTVLLVGSMTQKQKSEIKAKIASGEVDVVIGTNAIIQSDVEFHDLGLAVTDEQHRFGVMQRAMLTDKKQGGKSPHTLVMSATPIPRTLSLILYGDLDLSVLDELPPGRQKIETYAVSDTEKDRIYGFIRSEIKKGRQAFVVCPLVGESESVSAISAEEEFDEVKSYLPDIKSDILHGRMKAKEKEAVMASFKSGETKILVSTTVIEVGVDVPNASVMVIRNAERFGLSTLHQLRGRIGRGSEKSYCLLIYSKKTGKAAERLDTMCRTSDGFEIAQVDLKLRGPGDYFGERQSGDMKFKVASMTDISLIEQTRAAVDVMIDSDLISTPPYSRLNDEAQKLYIKNTEKNLLS